MFYLSCALVTAFQVLLQLCSGQDNLGLLQLSSLVYLDTLVKQRPTLLSLTMTVTNSSRVALAKFIFAISTLQRKFTVRLKTKNNQKSHDLALCTT